MGGGLVVGGGSGSETSLPSSLPMHLSKMVAAVSLASCTSDASSSGLIGSKVASLDGSAASGLHLHRYSHKIFSTLELRPGAGEHFRNWLEENAWSEVEL